MICPNCGFNNRDDAILCDLCGAPLEASNVGNDDFFIGGNDSITLDISNLQKAVGSAPKRNIQIPDINPSLDPVLQVDEFGNNSLEYPIYDDTFIESPIVNPQNDYFDESQITGEVYTDEVYPGEPLTQELYTEEIYPDQTYSDDIYSSYPTQVLDQNETVYAPANDSFSNQDTEQFANTDATKYVGTTSSIGAHDQYAATSYVAVEGAKKPKRKGVSKAAIVVILCLIAAAIIGYATYSMEIWGGKSVPDVMGKQEIVAEGELEEAGFSVKTDYKVFDGQEGIVIEVNPSVGTRLGEGSLVELIISIPRTIPDIVGLPQAEAMAMLNESGYVTNVSVVEEKSDEAEGNVLAVDPAPGVVASANDPVIVTVAIPYTVPDVEGMTQAEATSVLQEASYTVSISYYYTDSIAEGTAVSTDPEKGSVLTSGSNVVLKIARDRGKELVGLTKQYFQGSSVFIINGVSYELSEVKSVDYTGGETVAYSIVARPFETHSWFGTQTETRYGNYETITGTITWDSDNDLIKTEPPLRRG